MTITTILVYILAIGIYSFHMFIIFNANTFSQHKISSILMAVIITVTMIYILTNY